MNSSCHIDVTLNHKHNVDVGYRSSLDHTHSERTNENFILKNEYRTYDKRTIIKTQKELILNHKIEYKNKMISVRDLINDWNSKIKRDDRKVSIDSLFKNETYSRSSKSIVKNIREYEMIYQISDSKNNSLSDTQQKQLLTETYQRFERLTKGKFIITQAVIHFDETIPHLHLDFIPCCYDENKKKGIPLNFSLLGNGKKCFNISSNSGSSFTIAKNDFKQMRDKLAQIPKDVCKNHNIYIQKDKENHSKHQATIHPNQQQQIKENKQEQVSLKAIGDYFKETTKDYDRDDYSRDR